MNEFEFLVVLWDESGNILLDRKIETIKCVKLSTARNRMDRKYRNTFYYYELN